VGVLIVLAFPFAFCEIWVSRYLFVFVCFVSCPHQFFGFRFHRRTPILLSITPPSPPSRPHTPAPTQKIEKRRRKKNRKMPPTPKSPFLPPTRAPIRMSWSKYNLYNAHVYASTRMERPGMTLFQVLVLSFLSLSSVLPKEPEEEHRRYKEKEGTNQKMGIDQTRSKAKSTRLSRVRGGHGESVEE